MGGCGGMNGKAFRVADIGQVAEQLQIVDKFLASFHAAFDPEAQNRTSAFGQILLGVFMVRMAAKLGWVTQLTDEWLFRWSATFSALRNGDPYASSTFQCLEWSSNY